MTGGLFVLILVLVCLVAINGKLMYWKGVRDARDGKAGDNILARDIHINLRKRHP